MTSVPKISPDVPRKVAWTGSYLAVAALLPSMFAFLMLFLTPVMVGEMIKYKRLRESGISSSAEIVSLREHRNRGGTTTFCANLRFSSEGHEYRAEANAPHWMAAGETVPITFDLRRPDWVVINASGNSSIRALYNRTLIPLLIFDFGLPVLGILWILSIRVTFGRQRSLLKWGSLASGEILREKEYLTKYGLKSRLTYRFSVSGKGDFTGTRAIAPTQSDSREDHRALRAALADTPTVIYDPRNPKRNALYPVDWVKLKE